MAESVSVSQETPLEFASDKRWELIQRIASSTTFKKSPRLRLFLSFISERMLTGHPDDISEYEIGWKVFERGPNYNPVEDSIVRSAARQLRGKLKEYFETEGIGESLVVEIPKGGYFPVFIEREHHAPAVQPAPLQPPVINEKVLSQLRWWKIGTAGLAAGILLTAGFAIWRTSADATVPPPGETIISTVLSKDRPTRVVLGDFGLAYVSAVTKHPLSAEEYANRRYPPFPGKAPEPPLQQIWAGLTGGQMTSVHEVAIAGTILRLSGEEGKPAVIQHARQLTTHDFRTGNLIIVASPLGSPWIRLLEHKLNFKYKIQYEKTFTGEPEYVNTDPRPGEKVSYPVAPSIPESGTSYSLIARMPNLSGTGKILLINGLKASGAQAVGEFVTDPRAAAEVARLFGLVHISEIPDFEVLLSNETVASTPLNVRIVAHRVIQ